MFPYQSSFLSYRLSIDPNKYALLGGDSRSNISGRGTAVFLMKELIVLFLRALHVPSLRAHHYSIQSHHTQHGCAYYDEYIAGNLLLFPRMFTNVDSSMDNIVSF